MTPIEIAAINSRLDQRDEIDGEFRVWVKGSLLRIEKHVAETNGRVAALEAERIARVAVEEFREKQAAKAQRRREWRPSASVAVVCVVLGFVLERFV